MLLREQQAEMSQWILSNETESAPAFISAAALLNPVQGLSIYRNSIREIIFRALSIIYPVSEQLLGADCFGCKSHIDRHCRAWAPV